MSFNDLTQAAQQYFPKLQVKYKDQSSLMKFLGTLLFFRKSFMTDCTSIVGSTIYIPNHHFVKLRPISAAVVFLHELVHLNTCEKKACLSSLYVIWKLSERIRFKPHLEIETKRFIKQLHKPWLPTTLLEKQFEVAIHKIKQGERPYQDPVFDILDDLITKV